MSRSFFVFGSIFALVALTMTFQNCESTNGLHFPSLTGSTKPGSQAKPCSFNGLDVPDGDTVPGFSTSSVPADGACTPQIRVCTNGVLSGSAPYATCQVNGPQACLLDGLTIGDGQTVRAYQQKTVGFGHDCVSENRVCANGQLWGSYPYSSCDVDGPPVSCPQITMTVSLNEAGVSCTDTIAPYTGPEAIVRSPRTSRMVTPGSVCSLGAEEHESVYFGTVTGGSYGVCQNLCGISARCKDSGWSEFNAEW